MAQCISCNSYFRKNQFNSSEECESCIDTLPSASLFEGEDEVEVQHLLNPSGRTAAVFPDD